MSIDWVTLAVEAIGIAIFCIWVVVPIGEFRTIYQRIKQRGSEPPMAQHLEPQGFEPLLPGEEPPK